eukprot:XP_011667447.1 PREDICTED: cystine/glutamate transporter [Strongylocentrotus purpuratus]
MSVSSRTSIDPPQPKDGDSTSGGSTDGDSTDSKVAIPRHLGLWGCVWHTVGSVIGTGIFISPAGILRGTGGSVGLALIFWVACGVIQTCGGFVYAELAVMIKKSGGHTTYLANAFTTGSPSIKLLPIAFYAGTYAYGGW